MLISQCLGGFLMDLWEIFEKSGKIADYLNYKTSEKGSNYDNLEGSCCSGEQKGRE